mmetsp:Transcript_23467/g.40117  ORF Transcript_23467/g.40117 Transcript_23467/m.40117 type:complete len:180 (+) Transcript_23467:20-559(+)
MNYWVLLSLLVFISICSGESVKGPYTVQGKLTQVENPSDMRVQLIGNNGVYSAITRLDGSFVVRDVPPGAFLLDVLSVKYNFTTIRVDVSAKYNGKVKARPLHEPNNFITYPLELKPSGHYQFIQHRKPYDFSGMIRNLLFIGGICGTVIFLFNKIDFKENMKALQEMQEEAKKEIKSE